MSTNKKILTLVFAMLSLLSVAIIANVWVHFVSFGNKTTIEKANSIAESVRDGLTAHMALGAMDQKDMFLRNMINHQDVKTLRVITSMKNMQESSSKIINTKSYDEIEKEVFRTAKSVTKIQNNILRITIPYIATSSSEPNCLSCHTNVKDGDVLGAITLELNTEEAKDITYSTIITIISISVLFLIIAFFITSYFIKPYVKLFDDLEDGISKAYKGDFSHKVTTKLTDDAGKVAKRLNDLSEIFRFKKTIELDSDTETIYERLAYILENNFELNEFILFENDIPLKTRKIVFKSNDAKYVDSNSLEASKDICRSFRTSNNVCSADFHKVCKLCYRKDRESYCLPFAISDELSLTLLIYTNEEEKLNKIKSIIPIITNYFELAEPVLQTKVLMSKLHKTTLIDPMTGLNNRRFLDNYIDTNMKDNSKFSMMMVDIDFFKQVNDTYGHNVGDEVIKTIADVLTNNIKGSDYAIRYGGEEFLLIIFDANKEIAQKIANNVKKEFSKKVFKTDKDKFSKTLSIGISNYPDDSNTPWQCIKYADVALYSAKNNGRDKVVMFEPSMYTEDNI